MSRTPNGKKIAADKACATVNGREFIDIDGDRPEAPGHGMILGCGRVVTHAGDTIDEIALAIEIVAIGIGIGIGKIIPPHPTLGEKAFRKYHERDQSLWLAAIVRLRVRGFRLRVGLPLSAGERMASAMSTAPTTATIKCSQLAVQCVWISLTQGKPGR